MRHNNPSPIRHNLHAAKHPPLTRPRLPNGPLHGRRRSPLLPLSGPGQSQLFPPRRHKSRALDNPAPVCATLESNRPSRAHGSQTPPEFPAGEQTTTAVVIARQRAERAMG